MISIRSFAKQKEKSTSGGGGYANTTTTHVTVNTQGVEGVNIWGQYHDHTADISGNMSGVGSISASGNIVTTQDIQGRNVTATNHLHTNTLDVDSDANVDGKLTVHGDIDNSEGNTTTNNLFATNGTFSNDLSALDFFATNGEITNLISDTAVIENLTVTKAAHFYKLIIDEIKATQGQIIVTPANAEIVDVEENSGTYTLYFFANDETTGKEITNSFEVGDQVLCQTFNAATGETYDASNRFYWALCTEVSSTPVQRTIDGTQSMCHYIKLNWSDKDTSTNAIPQRGDEVVMLGNRTDTLRQNAITIGAYNNPYLDNTIKAPFIIQYAGINDYNLSAHRKNVISNGYNQFQGNFTTTTGDNIEDLINDMGEGAMTYMHTAYANNATGSQNFSKTYFEDALYMGFCSNHTQSDTALIYSDYVWVRVRGNDGTDGKDGTDGLNGKDGVNGADGTSTYFHVAYANKDASGNITDFSVSNPTGRDYIGTYVDDIIEDSTQPSAYSWQLVKGAQGEDGQQGIPGTNGEDGKTSYLHIKYSDDGSTFTANNGETPGNYLGQYVDFTEADSMTFSKYNWSLIKGTPGQDGKDGTGINIKGSYDSVSQLPSSGMSAGDAYIVGLDLYVWTGSAWKNCGQIKGEDGRDGTNGTDGTSAYLHIAYANSADGVTDFTTTIVGDAEYLYIGLYTDSNVADSTNPSDYVWSKYHGNDGKDGKDGLNGKDGVDGADGTSSYFHVAYANKNSSGVITDFSLDNPTGREYIGTYVDETKADSTDSSKYTWMLAKGAQGETGERGIPGTNGTDGKTSYLHIKYSDDGSTFTANSGETPGAYLGQYVDFTEADSTVFSRYTWTKIKGEQGIPGTNGTNGQDGKDGKDGADGETIDEYRLIPIVEQLAIDKEGTVGFKISYNILHITGKTYEKATSTATLRVYYRPQYETSTGAWASCPINTDNPSFTNATYKTGWKTATNKLQYVEVVLSSATPSSTSAIIYDRRNVFAALLPSATFEITDSITSTVQGHTDLIDGLQNSVTTIQQNYDSISSTVESHTTQISGLDSDLDTLDGKVTTNTTNITNLTQNVNGISATVSSHTTSINQNTQDIAALQITTDEIKSTVSSYNASLENLFNFSFCKWSNCVPFIQGYGIEGTANIARVSNLGFDGVGGDFVVSCQMKMQTTAKTINVNLCDTTAEDEASAAAVTTDWQNFTFYFKDINKYYGGTSETTTSYNGFIDFEGGTSTNRVYVRHLMINRGNVAIAWGVSSKDIEAYKDEENLVTQWTLNKVSVTADKYKGYEGYVTNENPTASTAIQYISKASVPLETNTPYTLIFYANTSGDMFLSSYFALSGTVVDGTIQSGYSDLKAGESSEQNRANGVTYTRVTGDVKKFTIHWYNHTATSATVVVSRISGSMASDNTSKQLYIYGPELRKGYWTETQANSQSLIRQTSNEIELKVKNTGINIEDGTITLDADNTTITGNLNLTDSNQGLIIYDQYGNPKITIQNETLGSIDSFDFGADKLIKTRKQQAVSATTYTVNFDQITLGYFNAGQNMTIHDIFIATYKNTNFFDSELTQLTYTYTVYAGTTQIGSKSGSATLNEFYWKLADYVQTSLPTSATYYMNVSITGKLTDTSLYGDWTHRVSLYCRTLQTNISKIATDGAVFASSTDRYNWFGSDMTMLRNGNSAIRLYDGKLQRNLFNADNTTYSTTFADLTSTLSYDVVNSIYETASLDDCVIAFSNASGSADSTQRTLYLPVPSTCNGKMYLVKNMVGSNTLVRVTGASSTQNYFIASNSNASSNTISIGNAASIFVSVGVAWIQFYCG